MSHYTVAVFTKENWRSVEDLLAPYDESITMTPYIRKTKAQLIEEKRQEMKWYAEKGCYAKYLENPEKYKEENAEKADHLDYVENIFPKLLKANDEELWENIKSTYGHRDEDEYCYGLDDEGNLWSTYNPNSKWDWYATGGRWAGQLRLKTGECVNEAYVNDLDLTPDTDVYEHAYRFWKIYIDGEEPTEEEKESLKHEFWKPEYYTNKYKNAEDYANDQASFRPYATLLPNGIWVEPGRMGWFGCADTTQESEIEYRKRFGEIMKKAADENWHITLVDCHI